MNKKNKMMKSTVFITPVFISMMLFAIAFVDPSTKFLGINYNSSKDYSCCKHDQLILHHYYSFYLFWIKVGEGFTDEKINMKNIGDCKIVCID